MPGRILGQYRDGGGQACDGRFTCNDDKLRECRRRAYERGAASRSHRIAFRGVGRGDRLAAGGRQRDLKKVNSVRLAAEVGGVTKLKALVEALSD